VANLLYLSAVVQLIGGDQGPNQGRIWIVFIFNVIFLIGFAISAYGLFRLHHWGRILFLWCITIWSGLNLIALFIPFFSPDQDHSAEGLALNSLRYAAGLLVPLWYLNLPRVKVIFRNQSSEGASAEETLANDNIS
jgi:ABC-type glycerol-3-phosphate transport system permease component